VPGSAAPIEPASKATPHATPDQVEPLTGELRRFHITVSKRFLGKLASARDALSHSHPYASTEEVLEAALDLLVAKKAKQKGLVKKPNPSLALSVAAKPRRRRAAANSSPATHALENPRRIPAEVKRAVWERDCGRCQWPVSSGGICGSTRRLELDHIVPVARGGQSSIDNLRVVCQLHNLLAARRSFGEAWMDRYTSPGS
jgi:5-methylcytosine-specific restriction endonuclease McrA